MGHRVLVTGGAGFIGSHLCERLFGQGDEVIYFGAWAPRSKLRVMVVPEPRAGQTDASSNPRESWEHGASRYRLSWAEAPTVHPAPELLLLS